MKEILGEILAGGYFVPFVSEEDRKIDFAESAAPVSWLKGEESRAAKRRGRAGESNINCCGTDISKKD